MVLDGPKRENGQPFTKMITFDDIENIVFLRREWRGAWGIDKAACTSLTVRR
jgi:hypothetical protein